MMFFAVPRGSLGILNPANAGANLVPSTIMLNRQTGAPQADDASLPPAIDSLLQAPFTAAITDFRPEDAKYATNRALTAYNGKNLNGLGYELENTSCFPATSTVGCPIYSTSPNSPLNGSGFEAIPVQFALPGDNDPITHQKVPASATISVGAVPLVFVYNSTNASGLGATSGGLPVLRDISSSAASQVFNGTQGGASFLNPALNNVPVTIILRDPMSSAMGTAEFTTFRVLLPPKYGAPTNSQEKGVDLSIANTNPLYLPTTNGGGVRRRAIGAVDLFGVAGTSYGALVDFSDSLGYGFFSYSEMSPVRFPPGECRYVTLDGVDPIQTTWTNGQLPGCNPPCPATPGTTFPHLRDGSYRAWSMLRLVTDAVGTANYNNAAALVALAQNEVNLTVPDFVPFLCTGGVGTGCNDGAGHVDAGMGYYRSHFAIPGVTKPTPPISNGNPGQTAEYGGDVGGCPFSIATDPAEINIRLNGTLATGACSLAPNH